MQSANKLSEITPATRVNSVSEYYFSKKLKEIAQMNSEGKQVINLGIGSPDLPPHNSSIETLCAESHNLHNHSYQPYVGIPELRTAFAHWYQQWYGVELNPSTEIQPLMGSKEGIMHISMAFLNAGDGVLIPNPGYPTYMAVSRLVGAEVSCYNLVEEKGWMPDFEELEQRDLSNIKLMWVNYPHMPTGTNATEQLFRQLVDFGKRHNIVIVNDNPYSFIMNDHPMSLLSIEGAKEICIEMNSMSKSHNMAGWRVAMMASNAQFVEWVLRVKSNVDSGMFRPLQVAAAQALAAEASWYAEINSHYKTRRLLAEQIVHAIGCTFDPSQVGLFLWARVPDSCKGGGAEISDKYLYGAEVFITPGFIFGSEGERYIRISLCANEEILQEALRRIEESV